MNLKMLSPWNWFKKEEDCEGGSVPVTVADRYEYPVGRIHHEIDQLFNSFFRGIPLSKNGFPMGYGFADNIFKPRVDIAENKEVYAISFEIPGVDKNDVELTIDDSTLVIKGEKHQESADDEHGYHRVERTFGAFQRIISLPADVDKNQLTATVVDGILKINIPKHPVKKSEVRQIEID